MTRRQPERALTDLGVPEVLHEPLTALLDALKPQYMLDTELETLRDEVAAIDGHLRDGGFDVLGHKGVRDLVSVLQGTRKRLSEEQQKNQQQQEELRRLQGVEQGLERVLTDLKVDKKGVPGLWRLACWYEDLRDREPSFAEVNRVLIEAGVPVGLAGVESLVGTLGQREAVLKTICQDLLEGTGIDSGGYALNGVRQLIDAHRKMIDSLTEIARTDIQADEDQEAEVLSKAQKRNAKWVDRKLKQGAQSLELLGEIGALLARVEGSSIKTKIQGLVHHQEWAKGVMAGIDSVLADRGHNRKGLDGVGALAEHDRMMSEHVSKSNGYLRALGIDKPGHVGVYELVQRLKEAEASNLVPAAEMKPVQVCVRLDQSETAEHYSHSWLGSNGWYWCPGHRPVKMCKSPGTKAHKPHPYQEADLSWSRCPGRGDEVENVIEVGECGLTKDGSRFHVHHTYETRNGATKHCSGW